MRANPVLAIGALTLALGAGACGCGGRQDPRTEDLTAAQHEAEARRENQAANERLQQVQGVYYGGDQYSPLDAYVTDAQNLESHAEAHRRRAAELRGFEASACAGMPEETRSSCPLLLHLVRVEPIAGGARLQFAEDADMPMILEHIECHLAFAAAQGREGIEHCALYVPGAQVEMDDDPRVITLTTSRPELVTELRERIAVQAP